MSEKPVELTAVLDKVADALEKKNPKLALEVDKISDLLEKGSVEEETSEGYMELNASLAPEFFSKFSAEERTAAEQLIAADVEMIKTALQECDAADQEILAATQAIEAAQKRKKKWIQGIGLKKGRLTEYKKPDESMQEAARRALKSDSASVRGMGSFFLATKKFKKGKKGKKKD